MTKVGRIDDDAGIKVPRNISDLWLLLLSSEVDIIHIHSPFRVLIESQERSRSSACWQYLNQYLEMQ
uniref:Bm13067 n=1 Tax=Brugia malayi TaxID=6279 RepID=A0A1I9GAR7_BRUMA|nr:Bm13067 [Brugia malayi]